MEKANLIMDQFARKLMKTIVLISPTLIGKIMLVDASKDIQK